jgi:4-carboxymuconolactone decarboxylase
LSPDAVVAWDRIASSRGGVRGPFTVLLHSPEAARLVSDLGGYLRFGSELDARIRELAILATAYALECSVERDSHRPLAVQAGVGPDLIDALAAGKLDELPADLRPVAQLTRDLLIRHRTSDATFDDLRERLGPRALVDLIATIGYYALIACVLNSVDEQGKLADAP